MKNINHRNRQIVEDYESTYQSIKTLASKYNLAPAYVRKILINAKAQKPISPKAYAKYCTDINYKKQCENKCTPLKGEIFKLINGYERAWISNYGRILGYSRKDIPRIRATHLRKGSPYRQVYLNENNSHIIKYIHTLVCETFHGPRPGGNTPGGKKEYTVSHKDNNPHNNNANNLEWVTLTDNLKNSPKHAVNLKGKEHPAYKNKGKALNTAGNEHLTNEVIDYI